MENFRIIEVSYEGLYSLQKNLKLDLMKNHLICGSIHLRLTKGELKHSKLRLYKAEDMKYKSFIFMTPIFSEDHLQSMSVTWDYEEISDEDVGLLLSNIPKWDWNKPFCFLSNSFEMGNRFASLLKEGHIIANTSPMLECHPDGNHALLMTVTKEDLRRPKLPSGYKFGPLPPSAANLIHSTWHYNYIESVEGIRERIEAYKGVGIFHQSDHDNKNQASHLVSWAQRYMYGDIGMTYTLPAHRGKGLGSAVTAKVADTILEEGATASIMLQEGNVISINCHTKIGFKFTGDRGFYLFIPTTSFENFEQFGNDILLMKNRTNFRPCSTIESS